MSNLDILLKGGKVISGELGAKPLELNLGIKGDRIEYIGTGEPEAETVIELNGHLIIPGFIDIHNHSDLAVLWLPSADSAIRQGVTTIVIGNCGFSAAPLSDTGLEYVLRELRYHRLQLGGWRSFQEYSELLGDVAVNIVPLVGHANLRELCMEDPNRPANRDEIRRMVKLLEEVMEWGIWGLSLGLIYPPGVYADTSELVELAKVVAKFDGIVASHQRSEGRALFEALEESIRIARDTGVRFQISHIKAARPAWGQAERVLQILYQARRELDIAADQYPYTASSTGLSNVFPYNELQVDLRGLLSELRTKPGEMMELLRETDHTPWNRIVISECRSNPVYEGKSIAEIARILKLSPEEVVVKLLLEEGDEIGAIFHIMYSSDVELFLRQDFIAIASDSEVRSLDSEGKPHPRTFGTFAKTLERALRGELPLDLMVYKASALPASRLKLRYRGMIKLGYIADLLVIDPKSFKDNATYDRPKAYPDGVKMVLVNGKIALRDGSLQGYYGKLLRRT